MTRKTKIAIWAALLIGGAVFVSLHKVPTPFNRRAQIPVRVRAVYLQGVQYAVDQKVADAVFWSSVTEYVGGSKELGVLLRQHKASILFQQDYQGYPTMADMASESAGSFTQPVLVIEVEGVRVALLANGTLREPGRTE